MTTDEKLLEMEREAARLRAALVALVDGLNNRLCFGDCLSPRADLTGHDADCPEGAARRALTTHARIDRSLGHPVLFVDCQARFTEKP